ncbi:MAG: hypothetical protein IPJ69_05615 [Deltaproteobacteria bacterium]|nr:MAG: hypothetical protein IPJ69_05615 [Deltaproteobacteria bacterium]
MKKAINYKKIREQLSELSSRPKKHPMPTRRHIDRSLKKYSPENIKSFFKELDKICLGHPKLNKAWMYDNAIWFVTSKQHSPYKVFKKGELKKLNKIVEDLGWVGNHFRDNDSFALSADFFSNIWPPFNTKKTKVIAQIQGKALISCLQEAIKSHATILNMYHWGKRGEPPNINHRRALLHIILDLIDAGAGPEEAYLIIAGLKEILEGKSCDVENEIAALRSLVTSEIELLPK